MSIVFAALYLLPTIAGLSFSIICLTEKEVANFFYIEKPRDWIAMCVLSIFPGINLIIFCIFLYKFLEITFPENKQD